MILTNENYFSPESNQKYMSVSQFKQFMECESQAMAALNGEYQQEKTTALLVGSYVDAHFEGSLDLFRAQNPEIFKKDGNLKADYVRAEEIIQRIERDALFMEYMSGEKQVIRTAQMFGCDWKIKIDSLLLDKIVDLKTSRSLDRVMGVSFIEHWQYDLQLAVYQKVNEIASGQKLPVYIAVATKEPIPDIAVIEIPQWRLDECLEYVEKQLPHILDVKNGKIPPERCGICDYCKATKVLTAPIMMDDVGFSNKELKAMKGVY